MFEEQYKDLADAIDTLAELIRGLGEKAPATFEFYMKLTSIKPGNEELSSDKMLQDLIHDQGVIEQTLHETLKIAQKFEDEVVGDFMIQRLTQHRKTKWMLKAAYKIGERSPLHFQFISSQPVRLEESHLHKNKNAVDEFD